MSVTRLVITAMCIDYGGMEHIGCVWYMVNSNGRISGVLMAICVIMHACVCVCLCVKREWLCAESGPILLGLVGL